MTNAVNLASLAVSGALSADANGNVGIGTASPLSTLEINRNTTSGTSIAYPNIRLDNQSATGYTGYYFYQAGTQKAFFELKNDVGALTMGTSTTERARITSGGDVVVTSDGGVLGYGSGSGGTVTQATSKTTTVTLNKPSGTITMNNAALANGASVSFAVFNNKVAQTDTIVVNMVDDLGSTYTTTVWGVWDGYFNIRITNNSGVSLSEAVRINFTVINGSRA